MQQKKCAIHLLYEENRFYRIKSIESHEIKLSLDILFKIQRKSERGNRKTEKEYNKKVRKQKE